jgi:hypothetical protein
VNVSSFEEYYHECFESNVALQHDKTSRMGQILESEILILCESVLQDLSTNIFDIIIL